MNAARASRRAAALAALCFFLAAERPALYAQAAAPEAAPRQFPQWAKDLRRAEIVTLGAFPFSWFFTTLFMDLARSAAHGWDDAYWPWPVKPAGAIPNSPAEEGMTIGIAAGLSVVIALTDHLIIRNRRHYQRLRLRQKPPVEAVIEREPMFPVPMPPSENASPPDETPKSGADGS